MSLAQKILTGFIACTIILVVVAVVSFRNSEKFIDTNKLVAHTHEVLDEFNLILNGTIDAETGVRGFVISGNSNFLEPYNASRQSLPEHSQQSLSGRRDPLVSGRGPHLSQWSRIIVVNTAAMLSGGCARQE